MAQYYLFNKPWGCVTARRDDRFPTVMEYFPPALRETLHPVGRLDKDTEGLLLFTDDGWLDYYLMRPEHHVKKTYFFWALTSRGNEPLSMLENGVDIGGATSSRAELTLHDTATLGEIRELIPPPYREKMLKNPTAPVFSGTLTVTEGKTHQVRRMLRAVGCAVVYLQRISLGGLTLSLCPERGKYTELSERELKLLGYSFSAPE